MQTTKDSNSAYILTLENYKKSYQHRIKLRQINFNSQTIPSQQAKPKISQIKAIQKFIGKFKMDNKNYEAILTEISTINLAKYLEQISNIIASSVNEKQIPFYGEIATQLNREYEDFPAMISKDLVKNFNNAYQSPDDNKSKLKTLLLFTTELFVCGFAFSYKEIKQMLIKLVKSGNKKKNNASTEKELKLFAFYYNCDSYSTFLMNYATIFTQATPKYLLKWKSQGIQLPKYPQTIPIKTKEQITVFFKKYIQNCLLVLQTSLERIKELEEELRQNLRMTGQFNKLKEGNYNQVIERFLFTKKHLQSIIDSMGSEAIVPQFEKQIVQVNDIMKKYINKMDNIEIFENDFERQLYEEIPDLVKNEVKNNTDEKYKQFKQRLDSCKNKNDADQIAKEFQQINNKKTRKMLGKDILQYRKQYQLVTPFLCRIAAIVHASWKDIGEIINESLFNEYDKLKENSNASFVINDKKSRNLKYICQFSKFKIIESDKVINCIQNLIDDLKGHNIELLISALQSVGRFLYLSPQSANKFTFSLSKLENVMKQKSFPLFITSQLANAISLLKPHIEPPKEELPSKTPIEKQVDQILEKDVINDLDIMLKGISQIIAKKEDQNLNAVKTNILKQIENYDFLGNYNYAYMLTQLNIPQISEYVSQETLKKLSDSIKTGNYQASLLWSRFLGELFKYQLIKRSFLYQNLEKMLKIEGYDIGIINVVCTILETCDHYLDSKKVAIRNQKFLFLIDFKKFIMNCVYIPMLEQCKIIEIFDVLEPNLTSIKKEILNQFQKEMEKKDKKEVDFSKMLDTYLERNNLKSIKKQPEGQLQDPRSKESKLLQTEESSSDKNLQSIFVESKQFENQFNNFMNSNIKDYSCRIAKPILVEKAIQRRKDKKKVGDSEKKIVVIGRCGNKFIKKDVIYSSNEKNGEIKPKEGQTHQKLE